MPFINRMSVMTLAAINPVSLDLLAPAIPYFQKSLPALDGQVFFSIYLTGLAAGQFLGAFLLNGKRNAVWALLFCLIYCAASLIAGTSGTLQTFLLARFGTGFSAGIIYLFCLLLVSNSDSEEEIAENYRLRNQSLLYVASVIPFVSAAVISVTSFDNLVTLQLAYGGICVVLIAGLIRSPLADRTILKERKQVSRGGLIQNLVAMICWSAMLYFMLSLIPTFFSQFSPYPEWMICSGIATSAIFYRIGSIARNRINNALGRVLCAILIGSFVLSHFTTGSGMKFLLLGIGYFSAGVYQSKVAAKVLSARLFTSHRATSLLTFLNLLASALMIEAARRIGVLDALLWLGIPLTIFAFSPLWSSKKLL